MEPASISRGSLRDVAAILLALRGHGVSPLSPAKTPKGPPESPNPDVWESAYLCFERPEEEVRKFLRRLKKLGATRWPRDAQIVEIFCGRGSGMQALARLGFTHVEGVDLSPRLLAQYQGPGKTLLCDCRHLSFPDASRDIMLVQGGLHHLRDLSGDLEQTLAEVHRVLRKDGIFLVVEPWHTPFLRLAHSLAHNSMARRMWNKLDAMQTMIENEAVTYERWLSQPNVILACLEKYFQTEHCSFEWGKLMFVGKRR